MTDTGDRVSVGMWRWALRGAGLSAKAHHVALALSVYMDADGGAARPSIDTLAGDCSRRGETVAAALDELAEAGWIVRSRQSRRQSYMYAATVPSAPHAGVTEYPGSEGDSPERVPPGRGSLSTPYPSAEYPLSERGVPPVQGGNQHYQQQTSPPAHAGAHAHARNGQTPPGQAGVLWARVIDRLPARVRRRIDADTPDAHRAHERLVAAFNAAASAGLTAQQIRSLIDIPTAIDADGIDQPAAVLATRIRQATDRTRRGAA